MWWFTPLIALLFSLPILYHLFRPKRGPIPISVNYHFTRKCNLECGFCFHVDKESYRAPLEDAKKAIRLLKEAGMRKINFAGGEPFLYQRFLGQLLRYCKEELDIESCSIVSNGTKITERFLIDHGKYLDVLAISCDSFDDEVNEQIGRVEKGKAADNVRKLRQISQWCKQYGIKFKLNTVVNKLNWQEDMRSVVKEVNPFRWKCFQVLLVEDENDENTKEKKGNFEKFYINDDQFESFCERHEELECLVPESNKVMASSYLILDECLCFLDKGSGKETKSDSILEVGVTKALQQVRWDEDSFKVRGGVYDWRKSPGEGGCSRNGEEVRDIEDF